MVLSGIFNVSMIHQSPDTITKQTAVTNSDMIKPICNRLECDLTDLKNIKKSMRTRRRASLDVLKEQNVIEESVKWSALRRRRTSLPTILAGSKIKTNMSTVLVENSTLMEIRFLVDELCKNPCNVVVLAKKIKELLNPYYKHVFSSKHSDVSDDESPVHFNARHTPTKRSTQRKFDCNTGLFSTTTTATGLPKEEPGPVKAKRLPKLSKEKATPLHTPFESRSTSPSRDVSNPCSKGRRCTYPNISVTHAHKLSSSYPHHQHPAHRKVCNAISSDYESDEHSPMVTSSPPLSMSRSKSTIEHRSSIDETDGSVDSITTLSQEIFSRTTLTPPHDSDDTIPTNEVRFHSQRSSDQVDEGNLYFHNYQGTLLDFVYNWNFPIFELASKTDCVLSQMAYKLFQNAGLFEAFHIPRDKFVNYMMALEKGYREIPYHNKIHAADVLHGCWFLTTQEIPGFHNHTPLFSSDSSDSDSGTCTLNTRQVSNIGHGSLAQAIPALELLSLYLAASMHDYDHPGKTNAFLVETRHPLATLYNDRSVLENHHAAASWNLLYSNKNFDFLENLDSAEWKRLRFLIIESILATDLKKHFSILSEFSNKVQQSRSSSQSTDDNSQDTTRRNGLNWSADEDRLLVCKMVIKLADIGGPAKCRPLHITWTKAICEEFFDQGDEERKLNVPVSPFMDRNKPDVAELQRTFINNLITPIVFSMHKSGILAGEIPEDHELRGQTCDQNLLVEQLKANLNFWKNTTTPCSGHEEMVEAFKLALPHRFSFSDFSHNKDQPGSSEDKTKASRNTDDPVNNDEVFDAIRKG